MASPLPDRESLQALVDVADPVRRMNRAGELMAQCQQTQIELSRIRRQAIEQAADSGISYSDLSRRVGLTRGRISQMRTSGPAVERRLFGIGPIELAVPVRRVEGRAEPVVATEDLRSRDALMGLLTSLSFSVTHSGIDPDRPWRPTAPDLVAICGPKSSPQIAEVLATDPVLQFRNDNGRWTLHDLDADITYTSPMDGPEPAEADIAYLGKLDFDDHRKVFAVAGIHAMGSLGAVHYLERNAAALFEKVGTANFSMVIASTSADGEITHSEPACEPVTF